MEGPKRKRDGFMRPGQDLVAIGYAALHGTAVLAGELGDELSGRYGSHFIRRMKECADIYAIRVQEPDRDISGVIKPDQTGERLGSRNSELAEETSITGALLEWIREIPGVTDIQKAGEGGVLAALWELAADHRAGFHVWLRDIPILQESIELCETFDLNPYRLHSGGSCLAVADNGLDIVRHLTRQNIWAAVIGKVEPGISRLIDTGEGVSFLERPKRDELYFRQASKE